MSAHKETLIFCDGGGKLLGIDCPLDEPYGSGDARSSNAALQRKSYHVDGWLYRGGKDYCPACAKRLFNYEAKP